MKRAYKTKQVICTETGAEWSGVKQCALQMGINYHSLKNRLNGYSKNLTTLRYK